MRLLTGLFALFTLVTIAEIVLFVRVGGQIGLLATLAAVVVTALLGSILLRQQGLRAWHQGQAQLARGEAPTDALFDGLAVLFAGGLLLTPGFLTDALGLMLMVPAARRWLQRRLFRRFTLRMDGGYGAGRYGGGFGYDPAARQPESSRNTIYTDYSEVKPELDEQSRP